jgi:glycerol uptake facilitator-like aquaporin
MGKGVHLWIYWLSEFLGGAVAAVLFLVVNQEQLSLASRNPAQEQTDQSLRPV